jgi:hypothetical protein
MIMQDMSHRELQTRKPKEKKKLTVMGFHHLMFTNDEKLETRITRNPPKKDKLTRKENLDT